MATQREIDGERFYRKQLASSGDTGPPVHLGGVRHPTPNDGPALAGLMLDGYRGNIDHEGEEIEEAVREIADYFAQEPMADHSHLLIDGDKVLSAILLTRRADSEALVSYVMTAPEAKGRALAAELLEVTLAGLAASGESSVCAYITDGNTPSERLFKRAGFVEFGDNRARARRN